MPKTTSQKLFQRNVVLASAVVLGLASYAQAALSIVNSDHLNLPSNATTFQIPIFVTGLSSDVVDAVTVNIQIYGPGFVPAFGVFPGNGPGEAGVATPSIDYLTSGGNNAGGDFTGNFMQGSPHAFQNTGGDDPWNMNDGQALTTPGHNIPITNNGGGGAGLLVTLVVDLTGFEWGTFWTISMNANNGYGATSFSKVVNGNQVNVPVDLSQSTFRIGSIPEPSSIVLGLLAAAGFGIVVIRKRRARRAA